MKFLLVASFPLSLLTFRGPLLAALGARDVEVHVAAPDLPAGSSMRGALEALGMHVHDVRMQRTGTDPRADVATGWSLFGLMKAVRPDYVLAYTAKPVIYASIAAWAARVPHRYALITGLGHSFSSLRRGLVGALVERLYRVALACVDKVFFQNPDDEATFRQRGILSSGKASVVVNGSGVDLSAYALTPAIDGASFLLVARLLGDKGVREYVQAARLVRALHPVARFRLAGWIDEGPDAVAQSELAGWMADGNIEYLGRLADVRPAIARCSVYVLPSYREGTPRTVLEAMAMGRAVITTDAPGCRETVVDGDNGFLVPVRSVEALRDAMLRFIDDPTLAPRMGHRSRRIAEEKYDVHEVNAVMLREMGIQ